MVTGEFLRDRCSGTTARAVLLLLFALSATACVVNDLPIAEDDDDRDVTYEYVIGAGDVLDIFVWGHEELSVELPVRPDGRITTRLVEDLPASGETPTQLAREIERRYRAFVNNPSVTVSVRGFVGSPAQQLKVVGAGGAPQIVPYRTNMTLLDLMIDVGGLGEFSSGNNAKLVRFVGDERQEYSVRLSDLLRKGDMSQNRAVYPGDVIFIPESWF